jgi:hypothetical protein
LKINGYFDFRANFRGNWRQIIFLYITAAVVNFTGCCIYSFTGASVPEHLQTIAIPVADDRTGSAEYGLRELLTNELTQKFIEDNNLTLTDRTNANSVLECVISGYSDAPAVVTAGETVEKRRITISVSVVFRDLVKRKTIYERTFSKFGEYPAQASIEERRAAVETAIDLITDEILLDTVSGW